MVGARGSAGLACIGALVLACCAFDALAQSPVEFSGALQSSVTSRQLPSDDRDEILSQSLAYYHLSTYLWQPWIAVLSGDLNAAFETDIDGEYTRETSLSGDFTLSALPLSRYPFELSYSAIDSRLNGDYSGSDYKGNRAGLSGRAAFSDQFSLDYLVSLDQIDRLNYGELTSQRAEATLRHSFNIGEVPFNITEAGISLSFYDTEFENERDEDPDNSSQSILGSIYYRATPVERLNHDFRTTLISDKVDTSHYHFDRVSAQGVSTLQWRSPSNDVIATGAVRTLQQQIDYSFDQSGPDTDSALMSANAGVSWRITDRLTMGLGARANADNIETVTYERIGVQLQPAEINYGGGVLGSIDYRSLSHEVAGFDWHWDARADTDFGYRTMRGPYGGTSVGRGYNYDRSRTLPWNSDASASIGHSLERSLDLTWLQSVNASFLQELGLSHLSDDEALEPVITHSASFSKSFEDEAGSSYFRLYLRDTHGFGEEFEEFQTVQVDFSRQMPLGSDQSLRGDLSIQGMRQRLDENDYYYIRVLEREDIYLSARANLEYEYRDVFGVGGLNFLSDLRINAIGLDNLALDWQDELNPDLFRNDWRNSLQYSIGELWLSLEGTLFQEDREFGHYVRFTGRRSFDSGD